MHDQSLEKNQRNGSLAAHLPQQLRPVERGRIDLLLLWDDVSIPFCRSHYRSRRHTLKWLWHYPGRCLKKCFIQSTSLHVNGIMQSRSAWIFKRNVCLAHYQLPGVNRYTWVTEVRGCSWEMKIAFHSTDVNEGNPYCRVQIQASMEQASSQTATRSALSAWHFTQTSLD